MHLIAGGDDAAVHLVGALGGDEVGDLTDDVDVAGFDEALEDVAEAWGAGGPGNGVAGGGAFKEEVLALGFEAGFVGEGRELDGADGLRCGGAVELGLDLAGGIDGDVGRVGGDGDAGGDGVAVGGDDFAAWGEAEGAVAGVGGLAGGKGDLEVAVALDGDVEAVAGLLQVALLVDAVDGGGANAEADLGAGGDDGSGVAAVGADAAEVFGRGDPGTRPGGV